MCIGACARCARARSRLCPPSSSNTHRTTRKHSAGLLATDASGATLRRVTTLAVPEILQFRHHDSGERTRMATNAALAYSHSYRSRKRFNRLQKVQHSSSNWAANSSWARSGEQAPTPQATRHRPQRRLLHPGSAKTNPPLYTPILLVLPTHFTNADIPSASTRERAFACPTNNRARTHSITYMYAHTYKTAHEVESEGRHTASSLNKQPQTLRSVFSAFAHPPPPHPRNKLSTRILQSAN